MDVIARLIPAAHVWLRVADTSWEDPIDPTWAMRAGGRWNPAGSFPVLYMNEDLDTARAQISELLLGWPVHVEDLRDDAPFVLLLLQLPARQRVADALSDEGLRALGLPATYPLDADKNIVERNVCQPIGATVHEAGLRGVWYRSAKVGLRANHELAWFPADTRSRPTRLGAPVSFRRWWVARSVEQLAPRRSTSGRNRR